MGLKNRFVRSATWEAAANESGGVTEQLLKVYGGLASGQVGLIITSGAAVLPDAKGLPAMLAIDKDELIGGHAELTSLVHETGGKIILQLGYVGTTSPVDLPEIYSPSSIPDLATG